MPHQGQDGVGDRREDRVVARYLERHGHARDDERDRLEALARRAGPFDAALVIPVRDEAPQFLQGSGLSQIVDRRLLVIVIVNGTEPGPRDRQLLEDPTSALPRPPHEVVVLDRVRRDRAFGARDGVGLARKIGLDLALELWRQGHVRSAWLHTTDADATLPPDHFATPDLDDDPAAVARVARFWHDTAAGGPVALATAHYELWMRYYVAGLAHAGSPHAFDALGSCISVHARAYARVGGVPRRQAGEDFHLLAKLAKLGTVHRVSRDRPPVRLRCRASSRVPFGTGPGVMRLVATLEAGQEPRLHDPRVFGALSHLVAAIEQPTRPVTDAFDELSPAVRRVLDDLDLPRRLERATQSATSPVAVTRRRHECFDALRTLQLVHRLRDAVWPDQTWSQALAEAAFVDVRPPGPTDLAGLDAVRRDLERRPPVRSGLTG